MTESSGNEKRRDAKREVRGLLADSRVSETYEDQEPGPNWTEEEVARLVEFFRILDRWDREMTAREAGKKVA
jgi:hypothetical protein